jgi:hypothetical protein
VAVKEKELRETPAAEVTKRRLFEEDFAVGSSKTTSSHVTSGEDFFLGEDGFGIVTII